MEDKFTNIKERILYISEFKGVTKETFFEKIGMSYGNFKGKSKETPINSKALEDILSIYPDINPIWLITGKGEILNSSFKVEEPEAIYKLRTDNTIEHQQIPYYELEASAGIVPLFEGNTTEKPKDYISIPNLPKCDGALPITGDSMYPLLKSGDIIMYKQINDIPNNIYFGEMYLLSLDMDGEEYVTVKFIQRSDLGTDYIKLVSQNAHHQPKEVHLSKLKALAIVKASIRINAMS